MKKHSQESARPIDLLAKNKRLLFGLVAGVLIILPVGVYTNYRNTNQKNIQSDTSKVTDISKNTSRVANLEAEEQDSQSSQKNSNAPTPASNSLNTESAAVLDAQKSQLAEYKRCLETNKAAADAYVALRDSIVTSHRNQEDYINANFNSFDRKPLLIKLYADSQDKADSAFATYKSKVKTYGPTYFNATCVPGYTSGFTFTKPYGI